jgi:acetate kinase
MKTVLALNAGSATLKFALYRADRLRLLARGLVDHWGGDGQHLAITGGGGEPLFDGQVAGDAEAAIAFILDWRHKQWPDAEIAAVGHRIVHGGAEFRAPQLVTPEVTAKLEALSSLAPLHQPVGLMGLRLAQHACPATPQVASFDTAFHSTMSETAARIALPREFEAKGIRRYGFHGLSYAYIAGRLEALDPALAKGRVVVAHLGSGASLCALHEGQSVDTTMGFSALDGLVMGTRTGSIDPGVLLHLLDDGMSSSQLSDLLYQRSGLLGVSGISADMRVLLASDQTPAREAIDLYVRRIVRETGALAAVLGGIDGYVFTAGVGEHAAVIRTLVCKALEWFGFSLDEAANAQGGERRISTANSKPVWVIPTDEEQVIAREAVSVVSNG